MYDDWEGNQKQAFNYGFIDELIEVTLRRKDTKQETEKVILARVYTFRPQTDLRTRLGILKTSAVSMRLLDNAMDYSNRFHYYAHIGHVLDKIFLLPRKGISGLTESFVFEGIDIQTKNSIAHHNRIGSSL